jgi:hypothetical protein
MKMMIFGEEILKQKVDLIFMIVYKIEKLIDLQIVLKVIIVKNR